MKVPVYNMAGKEVDEIELPATVFEAKINRGLMHQALVRQLANARLGTHKAKGRSEINRTTAKAYRQKGRSGHDARVVQIGQNVKQSAAARTTMADEFQPIPGIVYLAHQSVIIALF